MTAIRVTNVSPNLKLLDLQPPIPGYGKFISSYLVNGGKKAVIDPGPAVATHGLLEALAESGTKPEEIDYIVLTHIHIDHAGGAGNAVKAMPNAMVVVHERAVHHLVNPQKLWNASLLTLGDLAIKYGEIEPVPAGRIVAAQDNMKLDLGGRELEIYFTPGHAIHHLSLFDRASGILLAGEAAGVCTEGKVRPATPPPFKLEEMLASVDKLIELKPTKLCYGHFGCYDNGLARLKQYREKLLTWHKTVNEETGRSKNPEEILAILREQDSDLSYLEKLGDDEYKRELILLLNSIRGMSSTSQIH
ncbi:MAG: MBL fold metallo-hydrolase [Dehalococcoidia bacterium]|jgi:glyoxylase-like metal-dependent hydrolase (beta-lactamase superfamily II)